MKELVSIIIPVYNVKEYLSDCIKSVLDQDYKSLEIIIVDDGSTDGSSELCDRIKENDNRIKVYHKKNGGLSDARNYGMKRASGNWIMFIDSDDFIDSRLISHLKGLVDKCHAELAICDPVHTYPKKPVKFEKCTKIVKYTSKEAVEEMLYQTSFLVSAWGKLYSKPLFENIEFPVGKLFEDSAIMYKLMENANCIVYSNAKLYAYMHRENSITTKPFSKRDLDFLEITDAIEEHYQDDRILHSAAISYKCGACMRVILNAPDDNAFSGIVKKCAKYIKDKRKTVLSNAKARRKLKIAIILFTYFRPIIKPIYKRVNRWK